MSPTGATSPPFDPGRVDFDKSGGLVPAVVQHADGGNVLMVGYMDRAALAATLASGEVTFFSRTRQRLWRKGETSGNVLDLVHVGVDCDADALLVHARPRGPVCHRGTPACFDLPGTPLAFLSELEALVERRHRERPQGSYTTRLFEQGARRLAQKVGEEGVETALAGVAGDDPELLSESADLLFHLLVLLRARGLGLREVVAVLEERHRVGS